MLAEFIIEKNVPRRVLAKNVPSDLRFSLFRNVLSFQTKGSYFSELYRRGIWDGRIRLYKKLDNNDFWFPIGLLERVKAFMSLNKKEYIIRDNRETIPLSCDINKEMLKGITLWDFQVEAIKKCIESKNGIVMSPTGSGKTEIAIGIMKVLNRPTIFLTGRKKYALQVYHRIIKRIVGKNNKSDVGIIGAGLFKIGKFNVCIVSSLISNKNKEMKENLLKEAQILIIDETHHLASSSFLKIVRMCPATYRIGLSATPLDRSDNRNLATISETGEIIYKVHYSELVKSKVLAELIPKFIKFNHGGIWNGSYSYIYWKNIVQNSKRNSLLCRLVERFKDQKVMILVQRIKHGFILRDMLSNIGLKSRFVNGKNTIDVINRSLNIFERAKRGIIITSPIFQEGIDLPSLNCIINAAGGKSKIQTIQRIGRALRKKNIPAQYIDIYDTGCIYLQNHSKKRFKDCSILREPELLSIYEV